MRAIGPPWRVGVWHRLPILSGPWVLFGLSVTARWLMRLAVAGLMATARVADGQPGNCAGPTRGDK
jgi:hypothetical protein